MNEILDFGSGLAKFASYKIKMIDKSSRVVILVKDEKT